MYKNLYKYNNINVARKAYNEGEKIIMVANKVNPNNAWGLEHEMHKDDFKQEGGLHSSDFDIRVNNFKYYNCNYESGYYCSFYVDVIKQG